MDFFSFLQLPTACYNTLHSVCVHFQKQEHHLLTFLISTLLSIIPAISLSLCLSVSLSLCLSVSLSLCLSVSLSLSLCLSVSLSLCLSVSLSLCLSVSLSLSLCLSVCDCSFSTTAGPIGLKLASNIAGAPRMFHLATNLHQCYLQLPFCKKWCVWAAPFDRSFHKNIDFCDDCHGGLFVLPFYSADTYIGTNSTLQLFTAKVGNSYLCVDEKTVTLSSGITLHMRNVQLQPFHVNNGKFGTAENCASDIAGLLIPIIVGAVLALLLLIVLIVYVIGRRRSHAGYQAI
uniref:Uncharacterized protein n=1 Tax=Eptatretus burgeri TaxID=7764 RepID=A0A8C4QSW2_EPTBU